MSKKRWFRFHIERWRDGTFGLSPNEIAAYITMLCELYEHDGCAISPDLDVMARRCGLRPSSFRKALDGLIARRKLHLEAGVYTAKAVSEEIKSREKVDEKSEESRQKLAKKRKENNEVLEKLPSIYRNQNTERITLEGSALHPASDAASAAMAGFYERQRNRGVKHN